MDEQIKRVKVRRAALSQIIGILSALSQEDQSLILAEAALCVDEGIAPRVAAPKPLAAPLVPPPVLVEKKPSTAAKPANEDAARKKFGAPSNDPSSAAVAMRMVLDAATDWLGSAEILVAAQKISPGLDPLNVYSAISKNAKRGKIARTGDTPKSMKYATLSHAAGWTKLRAGGAR